MSDTKKQPKSKPFWEFRAAAEGEDNGADLLLYGEISDSTWWGDEVTPKQFKEDMDALGDIDTLNVYINSPGGDVFAGSAIYSMLKRHKAHVNTIIDGLAASAASVVAMAGDTVIMPKNAMMMIHNPSCIVWGDANECRKMAETLDKVRESMVAAYQDKCGLDAGQITQMMDDEKWMGAEECKELGFCDEIENAKQVAASLSGRILSINGRKFDLSRFKNMPKVFVPRAGVAPSDVSREKAPEDEAWNAPALGDFTDKSWDDLTEEERRQIAGHYAWAAEMPPETFGDLKLPHHRASDGAIVWDGVANCAARLGQTDIPSEDVSKVQSHLGSHYQQFGKTPPWEEEKGLFRGEGRALSAANEQKIRDVRDALSDVLSKVEVDNPPPQNKIPFPKSKQADLGLLTALQLQMQVNKNRRYGNR